VVLVTTSSLVLNPWAKLNETMNSWLKEQWIARTALLGTENPSNVQLLTPYTDRPWVPLYTSLQTDKQTSVSAAKTYSDCWNIFTLIILDAESNGVTCISLTSSEADIWRWLLGLSFSIITERRKLSYRKDDCAMRHIYGCPENFRESLSTSTATVAEIFNIGLLY